ncbi:MAG TPA: hypothetical protein VIQ30_22650 [Pseudonocardia sp.]
MLVYATTDDLTTWTGEAAPANAAILLRSASGLIGEQTSLALYDVDAAGLPTDPAVVEAFRDATCAQAAAWAALGVDPVKGPAGVTPAVVGKQLGTAQLQYAAPATDARAAVTTQLVDDARRILTQAGLLSLFPLEIG